MQQRKQQRGGGQAGKKRRRPQQSLVTQAEKTAKKAKIVETPVAPVVLPKNDLISEAKEVSSVLPATYVASEADVKELLEVIRGELTKEEFANELWNQLPFVSSNSVSRLCKLLGGPQLNFEYVRSLYRAQKMYLQKDVKLLQYSTEDDEVTELQESGELGWDEALTLMKEEGWALSLPALHWYSPSVLRLYSLFSSYFGGNDGVQIEFTLAPFGSHPAPPLANGRHVFLCQLEGAQDVHIFKAPDSATAQRGVTDQEAVVYGLADLLAGGADLHVDSLLVEQGDIVYIPGTQDFIYFRQPMDALEKEEERRNKPKKKKELEKEEHKGKSLDIIITVPNQVSVEGFLELVSKEASATVLGQGTKVPAKFPSIFKNVKTTEDKDKAKKDSELISQVLQKSIEISPKIQNYLEFRSQFHKSDFTCAMPTFDLISELKKNQGLVVMENFLPDAVASKLESVLKGILEHQWVATEAERDYEHNNIAHTFVSSKSFAYSESVFDIFRRLVPQQLMTISAARYTKGHFIEKHDDRALKTINEQVYERDIAVVYYLSRDFNEEDGGAFVDLNAGDDQPKPFIPKFNSLVAFNIPREHAVAPVLSDKSRYSLFGWFLKPHLPTEEEQGEDSEAEPEEPEGQEGSGEEEEASQ
eukprot:TRINITY_DN214_c0_g1_i10.p1 TRINITY_DN214_c0_g1~~TRINITY_DN214_c0_g1_i10.p1  ORF type:complete len:644 (-),score=207.53 TRINITY_DN214_c0_g1_i10:45-1976(-)